MLGRNPPKWNSFKPRLFKNQSLRKSLQWSIPGSRASRGQKRTQDTVHPLLCPGPRMAWACASPGDTKGRKGEPIHDRCSINIAQLDCVL